MAAYPRIVVELFRDKYYQGTSATIIEPVLDLALSGGEDYELLFTVDPGKVDRIEALGVPLVNERADYLEPRPVGWSPCAFVAVTPIDLSVSGISNGREFLGGTSFANSRVACQHDDLSPACNSPFQAGDQLADLSLAAHEASADNDLADLVIPRVRFIRRVGHANSCSAVIAQRGS